MPIKRQFEERADGSKWTRKIDNTTGQIIQDWTAVEPVAIQEPETSLVILAVVAKYQAPGEPKHWSLFGYRPDSSEIGPGQVWQVNGDAEMMYHQHAAEVDLFESSSVAWHQVVNGNVSDSQFAKVDHIARREPAPWAQNRASVTENCQGWVIRVLRKLVNEGIVRQSDVDVLQGYMDPVN